MSRKSYHWNCRQQTIHLGRRTVLMGILNLTPDSFHPESRVGSPEEALERAERMLSEGADILDLGGESSRPGAEPVGPAEELRRVLPVVRELRKRFGVPLSVDTVRAEVARRCLLEGADIVNDISALSQDPDMARVVAESGAGAVLMHMRGIPSNMQQIPPSPDILGELRADLAKAVARAEVAGIRRDRIVLDPGIGFGKSVEDNLIIINRLDRLAEFDLPILLGTSRKSFISRVLGVSASDRLWGTAASLAIAVARGAHIVRVHDVAEMRMVVDLSDAIANQEK